MRKPTLGERLNKISESEFPEGGPTIYLTLRTFGQGGSTSRTGKGDPSIYLTDPSSRERVLGIDPFVLHREEINRIV